MFITVTLTISFSFFGCEERVCKVLFHFTQSHKNRKPLPGLGSNSVYLFWISLIYKYIYTCNFSLTYLKALFNNQVIGCFSKRVFMIYNRIFFQVSLSYRGKYATSSSQRRKDKNSMKIHCSRANLMSSQAFYNVKTCPWLCDEKNSSLSKVKLSEIKDHEDALK